MSFPTPLPPPSFSTAYYGFEPCCGGPTVYFAFDGNIVNGPTLGINIYEGSGAIGYEPTSNTYIPLEHQCYKVFRGTAGPDQPITGPMYGYLQMVPTNIPSNYTWDSTTDYETPCGGEDEDFICPSCTPVCYNLYSCGDEYPVVTTNTDLSAYVGGYAFIQVDVAFGYRCFFVALADYCDNSVTVLVNGSCEGCGCKCYEIIGTTKLSYIDCDGNTVNTVVNGYWKGCTQAYPQTNTGPESTITITDNGNCVDGLCPSQCFELIDCDGILDPIYSTAQSLSPYAILQQVVQIQGYDNCWIVDSVVDCDCAINVVVLQAYRTCQECNPDPNYILTNCDDLTTIIYTSNDLSAYVGQVVELDPDCPGCWIVDIYPNPIPSDVSVTVSQAFDDCEACKTTYYVLTDCASSDNMITSTDLSDYVGKVIILEWCPTTCWSVAVSQTSNNAGVLGNILGSFDECHDCLTSFPCICSRIKNHDIVTLNYAYLDCDGEVQIITLTSGQRSERICMAHWLSSYSTDYVEYFGNCTNGECPPQIYPKRKITPGYKAPICSTEKYEKITCKSAEILYKQVLTLRYGISNCCPDEDNKWLVKKELIDLQALKDPDYTCDVTSCGCNNSPCSCNHSSCGCGQTSCGCNTNLRACNSQ
jgi:hypothetical protein